MQRLTPPSKGCSRRCNLGAPAVGMPNRDANRLEQFGSGDSDGGYDYVAPVPYGNERRDATKEISDVASAISTPSDEGVNPAPTAEHP